jgi:hypothetical protein
VGKLAFSYNEWILDHEGDWVEVPETHIMAMKLEELCLVVGHGERMESSTAEIVNVDDLHTFFPKQSIGTDEKRRSCKS